MSAGNALEDFIGRIRERWQARRELAHAAQYQAGSPGSEFGLSVEDLQMLIDRGPDASGLLYERMHALGLKKEDIEHASHGLTRYLEMSCAACGDRDICRKDLAHQPGDPRWLGYCPNAVALQNAVALIKDRFTA